MTLYDKTKSEIYVTNDVAFNGFIWKMPIASN